MKIEFTLNQTPVSGDWPPQMRLLDVIREELGGIDVKEGCGEGECGACSILLDGRLANSCLIPVGEIDGCEVTTPKGVKDTEPGRRVVEGFARSGGVQCGFCTPGMLMAGVALLSGNPSPDEGEIREAISGNLCRCTGYDKIVQGIVIASKGGE